ncbi:MAG: hypothetical protein ACYC6J_10050 [Coriobacteriia bacterium]
MEPLGLAPARRLRNCRNTLSIAKEAFGEIGEEPQLFDHAPGGAPVERFVCSSDAEMIDGVRRSLHRLVIEQKVPADRVVILSPRRSEASVVCAAGTLGNFWIVEYPAVSPGEIAFCSLQRFKGLEADAVILCELRPDSQSCSPMHRYVAETRAKFVLVVGEYGGG